MTTTNANTPDPAPRPLLSARGARISAGLAAAGIASWFLWQSLLLQGAAGSDAVGSGAFPGLVAALMLLAAVALILGIGETTASDDAEAEEGVSIAHPGAVLALFLAVVALVLSFDRLPVYLAIAGFTFIVQFALGERRWALLIGGSIALAALVWLLFAQLLRVPL
ncbi:MULTISPECIES: tripartite tricarboxylate transporter TctB family protein [unclassified Xanthobacter]|uniref:tripartite tricarboxylate transporter TctB family protein n=1 Tax=unclassified Xanthobacter TaxID=2623496 RepID=UPI001EE012BB|nr:MULTISPECIES: tripartite tricarboxylate transporter TctB family protein [unclassified Xanthobacter]